MEVSDSSLLIFSLVLVDSQEGTKSDHQISPKFKILPTHKKIWSVSSRTRVENEFVSGFSLHRPTRTPGELCRRQCSFKKSFDSELATIFRKKGSNFLHRASPVSVFSHSSLSCA